MDLESYLNDTGRHDALVLLPIFNPKGLEPASILETVRRSLTPGYNNLMIYAPPGSGKTTSILKAMVRRSFPHYDTDYAQSLFPFEDITPTDAILNSDFNWQMFSLCIGGGIKLWYTNLHDFCVIGAIRSGTAIFYVDVPDDIFDRNLKVRNADNSQAMVNWRDDARVAYESGSSLTSLMNIRVPSFDDALDHFQADNFIYGTYQQSVVRFDRDVDDLVAMERLLHNHFLRYAELSGKTLSRTRNGKNNIYHMVVSQIDDPNYWIKRLNNCSDECTYFVFFKNKRNVIYHDNPTAVFEPMDFENYTFNVWDLLAWLQIDQATMSPRYVMTSDIGVNGWSDEMQGYFCVTNMKIDSRWNDHLNTQSMTVKAFSPMFRQTLGHTNYTAKTLRSSIISNIGYLPSENDEAHAQVYYDIFMKGRFPVVTEAFHLKYPSSLNIIVKARGGKNGVKLSDLNPDPEHHDGEVLGTVRVISKPRIYFINVSGHLVNFIINYHLMHIDIRRVIRIQRYNILTNEAKPGSQLRQTFQRLLEEEHLGEDAYVRGLTRWHSYADYILALEVAFINIGLLGLNPEMRVFDYLKRELGDIWVREPGFGRVGWQLADVSDALLD